MTVHCLTTNVGPACGCCGACGQGSRATSGHFSISPAGSPFCATATHAPMRGTWLELKFPSECEQEALREQERAVARQALPAREVDMEYLKNTLLQLYQKGACAPSCGPALRCASARRGCLSAVGKPSLCQWSP
jgi:hypothetical protein